MGNKKIVKYKTLPSGKKVFDGSISTQGFTAPEPSRLTDTPTISDNTENNIKNNDINNMYEKFQKLSSDINDIDTMDIDDERFDEIFTYTEHDYDPRWDYNICLDQLNPPHPLLKVAQNRADFLATLDETPFEKAHVYPAVLNENVVALYCSGTYCEPIFLINIKAHEDPEVISPLDEIRRSVDHEATHAIQEHDNGESDWADEDHAEHHQFPLK